MSRLSFGWSRRLEREVRRDGALGWLERQLAPADVHDACADSIASWFPLLSVAPKRLWHRYEAGHVKIQEVGDDLARWTILRQIHSRRQVAEVMADFWSNLLYVPSPNDKCWTLRARYDRTIRRHALGRFDTLLSKAVLHPAMLCYLDNWLSSADDYNENLGRELLELFTVGTAYTEDDVFNSAMILTGWTADFRRTWARRYARDAHYVGRVRVKGFTRRNAHADGRAVTRDYLRYLAHHPATARRVATRLAVRFVADDPPAALVDNVAKAYLESGTDIRTTLRALVGDPRFARGDAIGAKVRTPIEDYVAAARALGIRALRPQGHDTDMASLCVWQTLSAGQRPFGWPRPDGFPDNDHVWTTATRLLRSWQLHQALAIGARPSTAVEYRSHDAYLPALPLPFPKFVDEVSARLLYAPANATVVRAVAEATGSSVDDVVTPGHRAVRTFFPLVLTALLDSRTHMTR